MPWMSLLSEPITVAAQPIRAMGQRAMDLLLARINGDEQPPCEIKLPPPLIVHNINTAAAV